MIDQKQFDALLDQWIEDHKQEMIEELGLWVSQKSVSRVDLGAPGAPYGPDCRKMLDLALERCRHYGFETHDYEGYTGDARFGPTEHEISFVGHLDVVPEGEGWTVCQPYNMTQKDGFLFGRGVGDDKGPTIISLFILRFFKENNIPMKHGMRLMMGCSEETGMPDFRYYMEHKLGPDTDIAIVCDGGFPGGYAQKGFYTTTIHIPAGKDIVDFAGGTVHNAIPDTAVITVKGVTLEAAQAALKGADRVSVEAGDNGTVKIIGHGKAGHAAMPDKDRQNSAVAIAAKWAVLLAEKTGIDLGGCGAIANLFPTAFGDGLDMHWDEPIAGGLTANAGVISLTDGKLHLLIDIRYPIDRTGADITAALEKAIAPYGASMTVGECMEPYYIDPEDPKLAVPVQVYRDITGDTETKLSAGGGGNYARVVANGISFGPGIPGSPKPGGLPVAHGGAHSPDEALHIESWITGMKIYAKSVLLLDEALSVD